MRQLSKHFDVPFSAAKTYEAWVSSDSVIPPATSMLVEPWVGGHYRFFCDTPEFKASTDGTFSVVEPNERVVYTWQWDGEAAVTEVDVRFTDNGNGGCAIELAHTGFADDDSRARHDAGWDSYVAGLIEHMGKA